VGLSFSVGPRDHLRSGQAEPSFFAPLKGHCAMPALFSSTTAPQIRLQCQLASGLKLTIYPHQPGLWSRGLALGLREA
jgi:hypothetical protein